MEAIVVGEPGESHFVEGCLPSKKREGVLRTRIRMAYLERTGNDIPNADLGELVYRVASETEHLSREPFKGEVAKKYDLEIERAIGNPPEGRE